jgi:hypothetical protein
MTEYEKSVCLRFYEHDRMQAWYGNTPKRREYSHAELVKAHKEWSEMDTFYHIQRAKLWSVYCKIRDGIDIHVKDEIN